MKLSLAVTTPEVESTKVGILGRDFPVVLREMAAAGYDGVELMPIKPESLNVNELLQQVEAEGLEVPVIGTGLFFGRSGLSLLDGVESKKKAAWESYKSVVEFAAGFKANLNIGSFRGWLQQESDGKISSVVRRRALEILGRCAEYAGKYKVKIGLEPLNRYETNFINNTEEGVKLLKELKTENVGLILDTFHMNIEDSSFEKAIIFAVDDLIHIHLGDSNRLPPGYGHIDFFRIIKALSNINYQSYLSGEMISWPDPLSTIRETSKKMRKIIDEVNSLSSDLDRI